MSKYFIIIISILISVLKSTHSDLITDQIYKSIKSSIPCVRRLNATHQIGCGNLDDGSYYGALYLVNNLTDLTNLNSININEISKKLIIITVPSMFTHVVDYYLNVDALKKSNEMKINGIVLLSSDDDYDSEGYSDDSLKPNNMFSYYNDKPQFNNSINWNKYGSSYIFDSFKIPLYLVYDSTDIKTIIDCYESFNRALLLSNTQSMSNQRLCGMQLGIQMNAAANSHVCLRRNTIVHTLDVIGTNFCDPLGGFNLFSLASSSNNPKDKMVILSTQLDSYTIFEYYTPGASKPITSIITFLSIANLLSNYRQNYINELLFSLFSNEAFGYGGSSRFLSDLKSNNFINLVHANGSKLPLSKLITFFYKKILKIF